MSVRKILETFLGFFLPLSTENTSTRSLLRLSNLYDPRILCSTLTRAAMLLVLFPAVPTKTMVHRSFTRNVYVEGLTSFYGRFFVEEGQFIKSKSLHIVPPLRLPFFSFIDPASLWCAESSGNEQVYWKLFPDGLHSSKNNFFEILKDIPKA